MNEKLSALMDGELEPDELQRRIVETAASPVLREAWGRYHLVRAAIRQELDTIAPAGLVASVAARLEDEPTVLVPGRGSTLRSRIMPSVAGLALAASVAAVTIVGVRWLTPDDSPGPQLVASVEQADYVRTPSTRWRAVSADMEDNLNAYLVEHSEFSPTAGMNGVMSYVRFVGYDSEQ